MNFIILLIGLLLLLLGANYLVDSSVAIAKRAKLSDFIIGLTIVGIGTSAPELFISISSAINNHGDMSLGNVIGSNICNSLLILGVTAAVAPFAIERTTLKRDIPFCIFISTLLLMFCSDSLFFSSSDNQISRLEGLSLLAIFAFYLWSILKAKKDVQSEYEESSESSLADKPVLFLVAIMICALAALLFGGNLFLDSAIELARHFGMSESVISITLVALGTSLPELITSIIAATKGNAQLALGNVLGSNVMNILLILGLSSAISPINIAGINAIDFAVLISSAILTFIAAFTLRKRVIDRAEGAIFIIIYLAYSIYLIL